MSRRIFNCKQIITPSGKAGSRCPQNVYNNNCLECPYNLRIGKLGNGIWVDCGYEDNELVEDLENE